MNPPPDANTPPRLKQRAQFMPAASLTMALILLIAGISAASYLERSHRSDQVNEISAQARILASSVTAALAFGDRAAAQDYVNALRENPSIEAAGVYGADGLPFASFSRVGADALPAHLDGLTGGAADDRLTVTMPAAQGGATLGRVYLRAEIEPAARIWARYGIIALLGLMAAVVVGVQTRAQSALRRANVALEAHAASLAAANASLQTEIAERERAEAALRQAQKMEAVGQLTGGVAHDFNNLLMVISGGLDMLARQPDPARWRRITDGMRQAVDRGAALTRQLLAFARRQPLKPEPVALDRRICEMEELLTRSLRGDIRVEMDFATDLWPVMVDPVQLELAVLNLAVNARDAMPNGGVLTIRAENAPALAEGEIAGDFVRLSVADNGTGMSAEIISRAFEPFFTTKDVGHGSGLGLAQIYGFARQSGGVARIDSAVGRGTTVTLLLARSAVAPAPPDRPSQTGPGGDDGGDRASRANVLLVEDDDEVAALTADMIGQLGYDVTRVANAAAALGALANGRIVDIVFSDVMMPGGMSGADLAREIGRRRPGLPVLMTTGYDGRAGIGADDLTLPLLRKPYRLEALAGALSAALELRKRKTLDTAAILRHES